MHAGHVVQPVLEVVVGIIVNKQDNNRLLLSQRKKNVHLASYWEFPGGKVENTETAEQALVRELTEELGVQIQLNSCHLLEDVIYEYPEKTIHIYFYKVNDYEGEPRGKEQQLIQWVNMQDLGEYTFPEANQSIVTRLLRETSS